MNPITKTHNQLRLAIILTFLLGFLAHPAFCQNADEMEAHFINVGQGDAALLEFPCGAVLIDAGGESVQTQQNLISYLKTFFSRRTDLNNTLDLVILSHDHIDHDFALKAVAQTFHIRNFIDNGHTKGSGQPNQGWMEKQAAGLGFNYESFSYEQITAGGNKQGKTDGVIEPLHCGTVSPQITLLSGEFTNTTDLRAADYKNENNHSVVVRVTFGKASFLFTGDLEAPAAQKIADYYAGTGELQADVWKVSHHGSDNGTTQPLLAAIAPSYAVICCGQWNDGIDSKSNFTTYAYGHPRVVTLNLLAQQIPGNRPPLDSAIVAFNGVRQDNTKINVTKNIYCTAWDGNITIKATDTGNYTAVTNDQ